MVKALKRVYGLMLCLLLPLGAPLASEEELTAAEDLTAYCHLEAPKHVYIFQALQEHTLPINERFTKGQTIRVTWDENVSPKWLCIQWAQMREGVLLRQLDRDGNLISEDTVPAYFNTPMELMDGASEAVLIAGEAGMVPENISSIPPASCRIRITSGRRRPRPWTISSSPPIQTTICCLWAPSIPFTVWTGAIGASWSS